METRKNNNQDHRAPTQVSGEGAEIPQDDLDRLDESIPHVVRVEVPGAGSDYTECATNIGKAFKGKETLFRHQSKVYELQRIGKSEPKFKELEQYRAVTVFEKYCKFIQVTEKGEAPKKLSMDSVRTILRSDGILNELDPVERVRMRPFPILEDGKLRLLSKGYWENQETLVLSDIEHLQMEMPIKEAVGCIRDLICDYKFKSQSDESRAIAALLTPVAKDAGLYSGPSPIILLEADESQSGKTTFLKMLAACHGIDAHLIAERNGGTGSLDESFNTALLDLKQFIIFDNIKKRMNSPLVESFITNQDGSHHARGVRREGYVDPKNYNLGLTSNGLEITEDLANRSLIIQIGKKAPGFEFKDYGDLDFVRHTKSHSERYLSAIYSIFAQWVSEGRQKSSECRHSFRAWARVMDYIVQNYFNSAPLLDGHGNAMSHATNRHEAFMRQLCIAVKPLPMVTRRLKTTDILAQCDSKSIDIPGLERGRKYDQENKLQHLGRLFATVFKDSETIHVDGYTVIRSIETEQREDQKGPRKHNAYTFIKK